MLRACFFLRTTALHSRNIPFIDGALQLHKLRVAHQQASEDLQDFLQHGEEEITHNGEEHYGKERKKKQNARVRDRKWAKDSGGVPVSSVISTATEAKGRRRADRSSIAKEIKEKQAACLLLEKEFFREVEAFRPVFTMSASLAVSKEYTQYIYRALSYFGLSHDPLMRQISTIVSRSALRQRGASGGPMEAAAGGGAISTPSSSSSTSTSLPGSFFPAFRREEGIVTTLPTELPNPPQVGEPSSGKESVACRQRRRPGALRIPLGYRGHWVLQEPEIAITREERKEDPW